MSTLKTLNGNQTIAEAVRQVDPDVMAAYPITPSTAIVETIAKFKADGLISGEFVCPESEHSAMSVCIGAGAAGGRVMTATASQGLALMWEMLYIAAGLRLPIVAGIVNRSLSAPINIHGDHSDTMGARDAGWIQIYSENCQEAYDNFIQAFRIAEHLDVRTPTLVGLDGFIISHSMEVIQVEDDDKVKEFVGEDPFILVAAACDLRRAVAVAKKLQMNPVPAPSIIWTLQHHPKNTGAIGQFIGFLKGGPSLNNLSRLQWAYHEYLGYIWYQLLDRI